MRPFGTIEKYVGETPLEATERFRRERGIDANVPLAYAGRLDPMASGKLLILIGEECKRQEQYHGLDKEYVVEILFGISSDTGDVLGITKPGKTRNLTTTELAGVLQNIVGDIELPYPHFSSKTIKGKPLHVWTLEKKLHEIEIPVKRSRVYALSLRGLRETTLQDVERYAREKIETVTEVTEESKALGRDFRRTDVRASWDSVGALPPDTRFSIATLTCIASSGTYMRSLAEHIAKKLDTCALAYSIHRTKIGKYFPITTKFGVWYRKY